MYINKYRYRDIYKSNNTYRYIKIYISMYINVYIYMYMYI